MIFLSCYHSHAFSGKLLHSFSSFILGALLGISKALHIAARTGAIKRFQQSSHRFVFFSELLKGPSLESICASMFFRPLSFQLFLQLFFSYTLSSSLSCPFSRKFSKLYFSSFALPVDPHGTIHCLKKSSPLQYSWRKRNCVIGNVVSGIYLLSEFLKAFLGGQSWDT